MMLAAAKGGMRHLVCARDFERPALLMLGAAGALMRVGKTFLLKSLSFK